VGDSPAFASVLPDLAARGINQLFHYAVPEALRGVLRRGQLVEVPFGPRRIRGFVIGFVAEPEVDTVKPIARVVDPEPVIDDELLDLAEWISDYYMCHVVQALRAIIPPGLRGGRGGMKVVEVLELADPSGAPEAASRLERRAPKQALVLNFLVKRPEFRPTRTELARAADVSLSVVRGLIDRGLLKVRTTRVYRNPFSDPVDESTPPCLTAAQERVLALISDRLASSEPGEVLLHGVTGSGKTEVYIRALQSVLEQGRRGIVLVPEISLTPQTVERFRSRFSGRVAVLHSALSTGERYDQWLRIKRGEADVVIGARSAVFAPVPDLGLLIVDESHENTYKQEDVPPRYDAREVAAWRAHRHGALLILGSATPSVETYHRATTGAYQLACLPERVDRLPLPPVTVVDMREELKAGNRSVFSRELEQALEGVLQRREQALLFLNRRGYSTFVMCRECGHVVRCASCDITMTYHFSDDRLRCHYCDRTERPPQRCPVCNSRYIRYFGTGTQRIEEAARRLFPEARVARMDVDTTMRKGSHERIYRAFRRGSIDLLIGTQMITKGWDIPNVTLVGVVAADTVLRLPDYRSAERTFQLLTQVAGRTGRGQKGGRVIVQSYDPGHYAIQAATRHDYEEFYKHEIEERRALRYPPYGQLVQLLLESPSEDEVARAAGDLDNIMRGEARRRETCLRIMGPAPAPITKVRGRYRWQLVIQAEPTSRKPGPVHQVVRRSLAVLERRGHGGVIVHVDVDPLSLL